MGREYSVLIVTSAGVPVARTAVIPGAHGLNSSVTTASVRRPAGSR